MRTFQKMNRVAPAISEVQGLAGWLLGLLRTGKGELRSQQRQMRLIETLPLGGKKQLMLVECGGVSFLVGGGLESVQTIVPLQDLCSQNAVNWNADKPCE